MKLRVAEKTVIVDVSDINVYPGQYITVWLNHNPVSGERKATQVELRVLADGTVEIFTKVEETHIKDFKDWYHVE